jgi:hypothetical protein
MLFRGAVGFATAFIGFWALAAQAQDNPQALKAWSTPQEGSASLVLMVDGDIEFFSIDSPDKKLTDTGEWFGGQLVRQYRVPPGEYQFVVPEPGTSLSVKAQEGSLTYVRLSPYVSRNGDPGVRFTTWRGAVPGEVAGVLAVAFGKGIKDAYKTPIFDVPPKTFFVSTKPPWLIPPPPPKK